MGRLRALEAVRSWPVERVAAGWRTATGDRDTEGDTGAVFPLASVTKVLSALAFLVAVEEELVALDEPAGPPGSTVRHLLVHASGLGFEPGPPLAEPGARRIYGSPAFEVAAELVAERADMSFADYLHAAVAAPLGLRATRLTGGPGDGAESTLEDLLAVVAELLAPGRVVAPATLAEATTVQFDDLTGVLPGFGRQDPNPWGLGLELHGTKAPHWMPPEASPRAFGHFGQAGSCLWVDPDAAVALVALAYRTFGDWAIEAWPALGTAVLAEVSLRTRGGSSSRARPGP